MSLKIGDIVPNFTAKDSHGEVFESQSVLGRKPLVIYFYPKDNTPGCTIGLFRIVFSFSPPQILSFKMGSNCKGYDFRFIFLG